MFLPVATLEEVELFFEYLEVHVCLLLQEGDFFLLLGNLWWLVCNAWTSYEVTGKSLEWVLSWSDFGMDLLELFVLVLVDEFYISLLLFIQPDL